MNQEKQNYHHGDLRNALLEAALKQIREHGVEKLSLRAVARDAGVSQTAPYRHFKDKNQLLVALAVEGYEQLRDETQQAAQTVPAAADGMTSIGLAYIDFARRNPERYKLMFGPIIHDRQNYPELQESGFNALQVVINQAEKGIATGEFVDQQPFLLANSCWAKVHGIASLMIDGFYDCAPIPSIEAFFRTLLELHLRGLFKK
ncbi:MAG: TetR/AcrR family transcriptional regulator [Motiliproteus sp.]